MAQKGIRRNRGRRTEKRAGKYYLLAIAIDEYRHAPPLYNCVRDAERMIEVLTEKYQFEREQTFTLFNEEATEDNILDALKMLISLVEPEDSVLVLYSGHGEYETDIDEGYWIPVDAELGETADYVANSRIVKYIKAIPAHHILFIVDSCFSGSLFASRSTQKPMAVSRLDGIASRWLLTSGRNEVVSDGKPGDHSPFADNILYFLEHNTAPSISVADLIQQVIYAVSYNARQTPRGEPLQDVGHRGGQFHFHRKGVAPAAVEEAVVEATEVAPKPPKGPGLVSANRIGLGLAAVAILLLAFWFFAAGPRVGKNTKGQRVERQQLRQAQAAYDSLLTLGRDAFRADRFEEAKGRFEEAIRVAAGFEPINAKPAETALATVEERLNALADDRKEPAPLLPEAGDNKAKDQAPTGEAQIWRRAETAGAEEGYRAYLRRFPNGQYAADARKRIAALYDYRLTFPFSMGGDRLLKITLRQGAPPYRVRVSDPATDQKIEKTFEQRGAYEIPLSAFQKEGAPSRMLSIGVMDGNFKTFRSPLPF